MSMTKGTSASSQIIFLEQRVAVLEADNERLRAALGLFACDCIESGNLCPSPQNCRNYIARAALDYRKMEGRT